MKKTIIIITLLVILCAMEVDLNIDKRIINKKYLKFLNDTTRTQIIFGGSSSGKSVFLIGLMWDDVDFENDIIRIRRNRNISTKSNKERVIGINDELKPILKEWKKIAPKSEFVFPAPNKKMRKSDFGTAFKTALKNADIEGVTEHNLRHTCASLLSKAGVETVEIQRILGHSDINTTLRYIHYTVKDLQQSINKIKLTD